MRFSVRGVSVKIDFLFAACVTFLMSFNINDEIRYAILFSLLHEAGHLLAIVLCGEKPDTVRFGIFGMTIIRKNDISQDYKKEFITAVSGPMMNFFLLFVFVLLYAFYRKDIFLEMAAINLIIGLFNIMPVFSLDGGRALESLLLERLPSDKSEKIITAVSIAFLIPMNFFGFYILIKSGYNFTFLAISIYLSVMLFIKNSK